MNNRKKLTLGATIVAPALALGALTLLPTPSGPEGMTSAQARIDPESYYKKYEVGGEETGLWPWSRSNSSSGLSGVAASGAADSGGPSLPPNVSTTRPSTPPPSPGQGNEFIEYGVGGAVQTAADPLSTFALDVDTGSFGASYELVRQGQAIPSAAVRPEEWINAFEYGDAPAQAGEGLTVTAEAAPDAAGTHHLVRINVAGEEVPPGARGLNITVVMDTSGSMDMQDRLGLVKASVALLAKHLNPEDTISLVTFDEGARVLMDPTPVRETGAVLDAIDEIQPGGGTNLEAGLMKGYALANEAFDPSKNNVVLLASDGVANIGNVTADTIERNGRNGIALVTVGYGMGNYNDGLMEQLADSGDGFYSYLNTYEETEAFFTDELPAMTEPVALEAKAQVEFDPQVVQTYRLVGYENRALTDEQWSDPSVDAGEFGSGHQATALYEVVLAPAAEAEAELGQASVRWVSVVDGEAREASVPITLAPEASERLTLTDLAGDTAAYFKGGPLYVPSPADQPGTYPQVRAHDAQALVARARELEPTYPEVRKLITMLEATPTVPDHSFAPDAGYTSRY